MRTINLNATETEKLNYERYYYPCPIVQKRIHAVYLKSILSLPDWKFTKEEVLYEKYYDCPQKFHLAIKSFFEIVNQTYKAELLTLLTMKFQFFDEQNALNLAA